MCSHPHPITFNKAGKLLRILIFFLVESNIELSDDLANDLLCCFRTSRVICRVHGNSGLTRRTTFHTGLVNISRFSCQHS